MMVEIDEVRTIQDCCECAAVDACDQEEVVAGWLCCLEDVLDSIDECECLGDIVKFKGVTQKGLSCFAHIEKRKKKAFVSFDSIKLLNPNKLQKLWVKAYMEYHDS